MTTVRGEGKSAFVREVLGKDSTANAESINAAWKEAGQGGTISDSLVQKMRSGMGLTGDAKSRKKTNGGNGAAKKTKAGPSTSGQKRGGATKTGGRAKGIDGIAADSSPVRPPRAESRADDRVLEELEGDIDRLIFRLIAIGGLPEVEEALRRARRLLIRSHQG